MTIKQIVSTAAIVLALAVPAIAQEKEATASGEALAELKAFAFAQANDPDRAAERARPLAVDDPHLAYPGPRCFVQALVYQVQRLVHG